eukprot:COSAG02_NODE_361_length_23829_cov_82.704509_3_plen_83_part_00
MVLGGVSAPRCGVAVGILLSTFGAACREGAVMLTAGSSILDPGFCSFAQLGASEGSLLAGENWRGVGWVGVGRTISLYWFSL